MTDLIFLAVVAVFFIMAVGYVVGCERLTGGAR